MHLSSTRQQQHTASGKQAAQSQQARAFQKPKHDHTASLPHYPGLGYQHYLLTGRVEPKKSSSSSHPQQTSADTTTSFPPIYWPPAVFTHNSKPNPALRTLLHLAENALHAPDGVCFSGPAHWAFLLLLGPRAS